MSMFQKATKRAVRARIALDGPSGSGKTWTGLVWASKLGKKVALVDTERGSASLYADHFEFDVAEFSPPFHPDRLVAAIHDGEKAGYDVMVIDSLSHFWDGEGGTLELVDAAAARANGNSWAGWKSGTPILRHLIDTILATDMHVIATMRSKTEWTLEQKRNKNGEMVSTPTRIGMAPVMRGGVEYEFTIVGDLDLEHRMTISKSRCDALADLVIQPGRADEAADTFVAWTNSGAELVARNDIDALKARINKIEPKEHRMACKQGFADQFGNPDYLVASKLPDALAYVSGWEANPEAPVGAAGNDPGRPFDGPAPAGGDTDSPTTDEAPQAPAGPATESKAEHPANGKKQLTEAQKLHIDAKALLGQKRAEEWLDILIAAYTNGRSTSASDLTPVEEGKLRYDMERLAALPDDAAAGRMATLRNKVLEAAGQQTLAAS